MSKQHPNASRAAPGRAVLAAFVATAVSGVAHGTTSFPDYPLQTGTGSVPPNIMFILDDSGSMAWDFMPGAFNTDRDKLAQRTSPLAIGVQTVSHNMLAYDPTVTYRPWMKADGTRYTDGTALTAVFANDATRSSLADLSATVQSFYVAKPGATDLSNSSNFFRYQIRSVNGTTRVVRSEYLLVDGANEGALGAGCDVPAGTTSGWRQCTFVTPTGRAEAEEIANYATWYSYHRTRTKAAKAGASEAFATLGENFRVGYDSIWNRNGSVQGDGTRPAYPIPVNVEGGLFKTTNRTAWFDYLHRANANNGTPLHGALQRAGRYYETETGADDPWGPQTGDAQLSCRQSYAILTTDGYWNNNNSFTSVGNVDNVAGTKISSPDGQRSYTYTPARPYADSYSNTLADVAMHYWKRDLRSLPNNVPSSNANPAFWQHMTTFGISIGLQGTLDPDNDVALIAAGDKNWPDPWRGNPSNWGGETSYRIDDLLHASVNGRGDFVAATDPAAFAKALKDSLAAIQRRRASGSNVASNGPVLNTGSRLFQATYTSGEWSGDVTSISIVGGAIAGSPEWSMAEQANADTRPFRSRPVFTWSGSAGVTFPTATQTTALARTTGNAQVTGTDNAAYILGARAKEIQFGGTLRNRASPIGDIVNSSPFYAKETDTLYIGANDGMLHALDAKTGTVLFSYVPGGVNLAALSSLSDPDYQHRFFVDGGIDVTTLAQGQGSNILAASLGRGGRGVFGLNVSAPATFASTNVLWDKSGAAADADMGYVLGAPLVRKGSDGSTLVIVGNGIDSNTTTPASSRAYLFIYRLSSTGSLLGTVKVPAGTETGNGLAEPRAADTDGDGDVDYVYAGDLKGNVWRFDLTGNVSSWNNSKSITRLFTAQDSLGKRQPITAAVAIAREPLTDRIFVLVGTGRYISNGDLTDTSVQSVYGLIDSGATINGRSELHKRTIPYVGQDSLGRTARSWESYSVLPDAAKGWYVDLTVPSAGERVVSAPFIKARALWFSSAIPKVGSGCDSGGTGYLNAIDAFTGTNPQFAGATYSFFDVNGDGVGNDKLAGGPTGDNGFISSVDLGVGMPAQGTAVGNNVYACGSEAECGHVQTAPAGTDPRRLSWRELFRRGN